MTGYPVVLANVTMCYGATVAVNDVGLNLESNRIHGLLGRNGAGKSTLLSGLAALRPVTGGSIQINGVDPFENQALTSRICLIRESGDLIDFEKARVAIQFVASIRPTFDLELAKELADRFEVDLNRKVRALSRGKASALGALLGIASRAPLTMFDEVHLGMDAPTRQLFYDALIADFAEHPRTVILSSHLISEVESLLETVTILHHGKVLLSGEADDLRSQGMTLTGPADVVDRISAGHQIVGQRDLGRTRQVTLFGADDDVARAARQAGLELGGVPLQDMFIHLTEGQK
jgi:ABC-2 type transport system ATP-binding protein